MPVIPVTTEEPVSDLPALTTYASATQSLRDATKWVVATLIALGLVASLGDTLPTALAIQMDRGARNVAVGLASLSLAALLLVAFFGARVLIGPKQSWSGIVAERGDQTDSIGRSEGLEKQLDDNGVLWPWGYRKSDIFFTEHGDTVLGDTDPSPTAIRIIATISDFVSYQEARKRFIAFAIASAIATTVAVGCTVAVDRIAADRRVPPAPTVIRIADDE